jgi:hypothetical protein
LTKAAEEQQTTEKESSFEKKPSSYSPDMAATQVTGSTSLAVPFGCTSQSRS